MPEALLHAERVAAVAVVAPAAEADGSSSAGIGRGVVPADGGEHPEVLGAGERRVEGGALDEGADPGEVGGAARRSSAPSTVPVPAVGPDQAEQHRHGGGLAGAVGADEPGDHAGGSSMSRSSTTVRAP